MKHIFSSTFFLCAPLLFAGASFETITKQTDLKIADNIRLELSAKGDCQTLFEALLRETRPKLRGGLMYSLGCMQYAPARRIIEDTAFEMLDKCPAAILALAKYDDSKSALENLVKKGSVVAKSALFMNAPIDSQEQKCNAVKSDSDEKEVIARLNNLGSTDRNLDFLLAFQAKSDAVATAQCNALSAVGGAKAARKILEISKARKNISVELALGLCADSTDIIVEAIKEKNLTAVRAAKLGKVSEAEEILISQALLEKPSDYKNEIFATLEEIAGKYSAEKLSNCFLQIPPEELKSYVKIIFRALSCCDDKVKSSIVKKMLDESKQDSSHKKAAQRIAGVK